jgi:hypothetical protein
MDRPLGVTLIAIWLILSGVVGIAIAGLSVIGLSGLNIAFIILVLLSAAVSVAVAASGFGLLAMRRWAWFTAIIANCLSLGMSAVNMISGHMPAVISVVLPAVVIAYLVKETVAEFD